jgi:type VI secretion system protein ImpH
VPDLVSAIEAVLRDDPRSFGFFQAVRLLEQVRPARAPVGGFHDPQDEVARFAVPPFIHFPASEIHELELRDDAPSRMSVNFMGLTGPLGVLPHYYTLLVSERVSARDRGLRDFLDIFHHRIISLFYRAWKKNRLSAGYEKGGRDLITQHLYDLIGIGLPGQQGRFAVPDEVLLFYAGLLAPHQRSAVGLDQLIEDYFDVPVEVVQFVGDWYSLAVTSQTRVGEDDPAARLGEGAVVGDEIWDQQAKIRVRIGPLSRRQYDDFLPSGDAHEPLRALVRLYCNDSFDVEIQLVLAQDDVPGCVVGADGVDAARLGWSSWVRTRAFDRDADDGILRI